MLNKVQTSVSNLRIDEKRRTKRDKKVCML
jgi:hypothetical protein